MISPYESMITIQIPKDTDLKEVFGLLKDTYTELHDDTQEQRFVKSAVISAHALLRSISANNGIEIKSGVYLNEDKEIESFCDFKNNMSFKECVCSMGHQFVE